jgi:hypothetical protein
MAKGKKSTKSTVEASEASSSNSTNGAPSQPQGSSIAEKMAKLKQLSQARTAAITANRKSTTAEYASSKTNHKFLAKQERKRQEALELLKEKEALEEGKDVERLKDAQYTIEDVEKWNAKQEAKKELSDNRFTGKIFVYCISLFDLQSLIYSSFTHLKTSLGKTLFKWQRNPINGKSETLNLICLRMSLKRKKLRLIQKARPSWLCRTNPQGTLRIDWWKI